MSVAAVCATDRTRHDRTINQFRRTPAGSDQRRFSNTKIVYEFYYYNFLMVLPAKYFRFENRSSFGYVRRGPTYCYINGSIKENEITSRLIMIDDSIMRHRKPVYQDSSSCYRTLVQNKNLTQIKRELNNIEMHLYNILIQI